MELSYFKRILEKEVKNCKTLLSFAESELKNVLIVLFRSINYQPKHFLRHPFKSIKQYKIVQSAYKKFIKKKLKENSELLKQLNKLKLSDHNKLSIANTIEPIVNTCELNKLGIFSKEHNAYLSFKDLCQNMNFLDWDFRKLTSKENTGYEMPISEILLKNSYSLPVTYSVLSGIKGFEIYSGFRPLECSCMSLSDLQSFNKSKLFILETLKENIDSKILENLENDPELNGLKDAERRKINYSSLTKKDLILLEFENGSHCIGNKDAVEFYNSLKELIPKLNLSEIF